MDLSGPLEILRAHRTVGQVRRDRAPSVGSLRATVGLVLPSVYFFIKGQQKRRDKMRRDPREAHRVPERARDSCTGRHAQISADASNMFSARRSAVALASGLPSLCFSVHLTRSRSHKPIGDARLPHAGGGTQQPPRPRRDHTHRRV